MFVRLRAMQKMSSKGYRLTLDVVDPEREHWDYSDCQVRLDLRDEPSHRAQARGPLAGALELYRLSPKEPPTGAESKLLWDMGQAVDGFVARLFAAGIVCPFTAEAPVDAQGRPE
jgi:hypothetical protein